MAPAAGMGSGCLLYGPTLGAHERSSLGIAGIFARRAVSAPKVEGEKIVAFKYLGSVVVPSLKDDIDVANRSSRAPILLRAPQ
jgi:hypothetical protein